MVSGVSEKYSEISFCFVAKEHFDGVHTNGVIIMTNGVHTYGVWNLREIQWNSILFCSKGTFWLQGCMESIGSCIDSEI